MTDTLFDLAGAPVSAPEPVEKLSADRRRTIRQRREIDAGIHPITKRRLNDDETRKCGNCRFRYNGDPGNGRTYPKCLWRPGDSGPYPRVTGGAATDVRAWWPGCTEHQHDDTGNGA